MFVDLIFLSPVGLLTWMFVYVKNVGTVEEGEWDVWAVINGSGPKPTQPVLDIATKTSGKFRKLRFLAPAKRKLKTGDKSPAPKANMQQESPPDQDTNIM